jgi:acyl-CoA thioesterase-1
MESATTKPRRRRVLRRLLIAATTTLVVVVTGVAALAYVAFLRAPENSPKDFLSRPRPSGPVVVAAGASMTQASLGADWVGALRDRLGPAGFEFVNAGVNGNTSADLLARFDDDVLACEPDAVILLIGTNDVRDGVPIDAYTAALRDMMDRLDRTGVRVALLSLPPLGEDLDSPANHRLAAFNNVIERVAYDYGATYLPLHERLVEVIRRERPAGTQPGSFGFPLALRTAFEHYVLGRTWDEVTAGNGLTVLTDHIHLSDRAGAIVEDLVAQWLTTTP